MLPAGAQIAVLAGNPTTSGAYTVRLKFPANYAIPAHSHPTDENVVILSGGLTFGMGDKLKKGAPANKTLPVGRVCVDAGEHEPLRVHDDRDDDRAVRAGTG
jgi:hypothetical protein